MSYDNAKNSFAQVKSLLEPHMAGAPVKDPVQWQLAQGLLWLTQQIQADMRDIQSRLQRLELRG